MQMNTYEYPKSSFLGMAKDTSLIIEKILSNKKVLRLIYYNSPECLDWKRDKDLTSVQIKELFDKKQISNIPKIQIDKDRRTYLRVTFDSFTPNATNTFYRDHIVEIKIICHFQDWGLRNFELRPYRIAGEIDSMLAGQHLTGIGELTFLGADQDIYDEEYGGVTLRYLAIRGHEDDINPLNGQGPQTPTHGGNGHSHPRIIDFHPPTHH